MIIVCVFLALQRFVDQSLDSTRAELSQLLYPCFAHFYLKLIINGHDNSRSFYEEFSVGFGADSPYIEDIRRLATISNRKQLGTRSHSPFCCRYLLGHFCPEQY